MKKPSPKERRGIYLKLANRISNVSDESNEHFFVCNIIDAMYEKTSVFVSVSIEECFPEYFLFNTKERDGAWFSDQVNESFENIDSHNKLMRKEREIKLLALLFAAEMTKGERE